MPETLILESIFAPLGLFMTSWHQTLYRLHQTNPKLPKFHAAIPVNRPTAFNQNQRRHVRDSHSDYWSLKRRYILKNFQFLSEPMILFSRTSIFKNKNSSELHIQVTFSALEQSTEIRVWITMWAWDFWTSTRLHSKIPYVNEGQPADNCQRRWRIETAKTTAICATPRTRHRLLKFER